MVSDKEMKDIDKAFEKIEYIKKHRTIKERYGEQEADLENWAIVLTYFSADKLVTYSKTLTRLTIGLIVLGVGMLGLGAAQLVEILTR